MSDLEHARMMLDMAQKDLQAIKGMTDEDVFAVEIFGFHAQQAVEKAVKAWFSLVGVEYPLIHDLDELFTLLEKSGEIIPEGLDTLKNLSDYAVQFRYESPGKSIVLGRNALIKEVTEFVKYVEKRVQDIENGD